MPIVLQDKVIEVTYDGKEFRCEEFGRVHGWRKSFLRLHGGYGTVRPCCHALHPLPATLFLAVPAVARINWQPTLDITGVIVSRTSDLVTFAVDKLGAPFLCDNKPNGHMPEIHWEYQLYPMKWSTDDQVDPNVLIGVCNDTV